MFISFRDYNLTINHNRLHSYEVISNKEDKSCITFQVKGMGNINCYLDSKEEAVTLKNLIDMSIIEDKYLIYI
jgi:hypothetical protein